MNISTKKIFGLFSIEGGSHIDSRGEFSRLFCEHELRDIVGERKIVQINHSTTSLVGCVRGLHFQRVPFAEMKLIRCIKGRVWDVAVDLRYNSATFLQWNAEELSPINKKTVVIPEGFAHGFQVLEPNSELLYLHTALYNQKVGGIIQPLDPLVGVSWPLPITEISCRDSSQSFLDDTFKGLVV